jgi:hypothetical protein
MALLFTSRPAPCTLTSAPDPSPIRRGVARRHVVTTSPSGVRPARTSPLSGLLRRVFGAVLAGTVDARALVEGAQAWDGAKPGVPPGQAPGAAR